ncbi:MAG TPA: hypothetical protein VM784_10855 [Actinomycetota bacterium]|nr:hypothetical protein [Actinomycetota bacterium]
MTQKRLWSSMPVTTLSLAAVVEQDAAQHVHLPQLHRPLPLHRRNSSRFLAAPELDEVVALETAIDARSPRQRFDPPATEFVEDAARSPVRVQAAHLTDIRLESGAI